MNAAPRPEPSIADRPHGFREHERVEACPLCDAPVAPGVRPRFAPDVAQCDACRVLFRSPRPTQREIVRSYDAGVTYARWQRELARRDALWRKRLDLIARHAPSGRLLDVGTGDGHFLSHAATRYAVRSTEISETGAAHARRRGFAPEIGDFLELDVPPAAFDVITLWHVLEHVPWPGRVLAKVKSSLKPGGIVAVAVPNERGPLLRGWRRKRPLGTLTWGEEIHLTHFVPATLKACLARVGLRRLAFGVDDVHVERPLLTRLAIHGHRALNALVGWHLGTAMYVISRRES